MAEKNISLHFGKVNDQGDITDWSIKQIYADPMRVMVLSGDPIGQPRIRGRAMNSKKTGKTFVHMYDPVSKLKNKLAAHLDPLHAVLSPAEKDILIQPCSLLVAAAMPIAASLSQKKQEELNGTPHTNKPDIDNLFKFAFDVAQNRFLPSDEGIYEIVSVKFFARKPLVALIAMSAYHPHPPGIGSSVLRQIYTGTTGLLDTSKWIGHLLHDGTYGYAGEPVNASGIDSR